MGVVELKDYIESGKNSLKFVVTGKMGVGKSSLINGLIGKKLAKEAQQRPCFCPEDKNIIFMLIRYDIS